MLNQSVSDVIVSMLNY